MSAPAHVWQRRLGARFDPNGPQAHKQRFAGFRMGTIRQVQAIPPHVDLRAGFPEVTDQTYNCCVAESLAAAYAYAAIAQVGRAAHAQSSRMFLYYQARAADGMENQDEGAYIGSGAQSLVSTGICEESYFPYSSGPFVKPNKSAYTDALDHKAIQVRMVEQDVNQIRDLLSRGYPVTIGFLVFPSIQSATVERTGAIPMPSASERAQQPLGGHAVVLVGYDDSSKTFIFRNSWGTGWGDRGYGSLPYAYLADNYLSQDFWVILSVDDDAIKDVPTPTPTPTPVPCPCPPTPQPVPVPTPAPIECCTDCPPCCCCCSRSRLRARNADVLKRAETAARSDDARRYERQQAAISVTPWRVVGYY